jgi:NAD(P)-dependent dehydrogenase (short-subunit alcohol dehydrogenase family)
MDLKLTGKTALVTASTAGIGYSIAQLLANEGASVVINGRTEARVQAAIKKISAAVPKAKLISAVADLATTAGVQAIIQQIPTVDILVNNLGIYKAQAFADISDEEWLLFFNTNIMSGVRLCRHYFPDLLKKNWGRIVFISSESALQIPAEMIHYGMTKTAQLAIARGLAELTAGTAVTVNSVLAGPTRSEGVGTFIENIAHDRHLTADQVEKDFFENIRPSSLLKRFTTTEEVAALVTFICSPLSSGTNGAALRVDGGVVSAIV